MIAAADEPTQKNDASFVPATDLQLLRLGRHLNLGFHEVQALLDLFEEEEDDDDLLVELPPEPRDPHPLPGLGWLRGGPLAEVLQHGPDLLFHLRAVPGLFLFTDGVTLSRLERALSRIDGAVAAAGKIRGLLSRTRHAMSREERLFEVAVRALCQGAVTGLLSRAGQGGDPRPADLIGLLTPLLRSYNSRRT